MKLGLSNRLAVTVVLIVVALQAVSVLAFLRLQQGDAGWRPPVPVRIAAAAEALDMTPAQDRDRLLIAMNGDATRFFITDGTPPGYRERGGPLPVLLNGYRAALEGRDVRVLTPERRPRLRRRDRDAALYAVSVALADGQRLVVAPGLIQRRRGVTLAALVINFLAAAVAAVLVWRTVRGATRGLEAIAQASDRFAEDLEAPAMVETGGAETRRVAAAFNRMRSRIQGLMTERMRMLAAVAHDLKTMMTRLRLRVALIDDDEQRARADRDIALMAALVEDVLMAARGEQKPLVRVPVDGAALLADIVTERVAQGEAVSSRRLDAGRIPADPLALRRIAENLIENAVRYAGAAEVSLACEDGRWRLLVEDRGPGLPEGFAEQAFEPFARAEQSRSRETGGAGLGLSIARVLARQLGGEVSLSSRDGGGVSAAVILPS